MVKPFLEMTSEDWHGLLAANLHGYYYGCRAAIRQMVAQGKGGRVINVTSVVDIQPIADLSAYVTAKGGILGLTKTLAVEFGPHQITVNALSPGATDTPLNQVAYTPQVRKTYNERIPLGRIASRRGGRRPVRLPRLGRVPLRHRARARRRRRHRPERQRRPRPDARVMATATTTLENFIGGRWVAASTDDDGRRPEPGRPGRRARPRAALDAGGRRGRDLAAAADALPGVEGDVADPPRPDPRAGLADRSRTRQEELARLHHPRAGQDARRGAGRGAARHAVHGLDRPPGRVDHRRSRRRPSPTGCWA